MENNTSELEKKVKKLEKAISENLKPSEKEELFKKRIVDSLSMRIYIIAGIFLVLTLFSAPKIIPLIVRSQIEVTTKEEIGRVSKLASEKIEKDLRTINQRLEKIEEIVEDTKKKAEHTELEAKLRLDITMDSIKQINEKFINDVERLQKEAIFELNKKIGKFRRDQQKFEKQSTEMLVKLNNKLQNLDWMTTVVQASLIKKIEILRKLSLKKSDPDAKIQRSVAILVLKDLEDGELVKKENAREEARRAISELLVNYELRDEFFVGVRLRVLRAIAELGFVDITSKQVLDSRSWDRDNLILLLGALCDGKAIPSLTSIIKNNKESINLREIAIRSLNFIGKNNKHMESPRKEWGAIQPALTGKGSRAFFLPEEQYLAFMAGMSTLKHKQFIDPEIEDLMPRNLRFINLRSVERIKYFTAEQVQLAANSLSSLLSNQYESMSLRKSALKALECFITIDIIDTLRDVLFDECEDFGRDAIDILIKISNETSICVLGDFAINDSADRCLRLKCIIGLARIGKPSALNALKIVSKEDPDDVICIAANKAIKKFDERKKWLTNPIVMVTRGGWLGVSISEVTPQIKEKFDLKNEKGALVSEITPSGPADKAGIERGDIIVKFGKRIIEVLEDLIHSVALTERGEKVLVTIVRKGKTKNLEVKLGKLEEK